MSIPSRPTVLHEGPASSCVIDGKALGWTNCTPTSFAMGINKATLGKKSPTPCDVRRRTDDTQGGTNLPQNAYVAEHYYGVEVEVHSGANVCSPRYVAANLRSGRGAAVQGDAGALIGTSHRSTGGRVNHCVYVNDGRGWNDDGIPTEVLVYDPAADGRVASWGTADTSWAWWPWGLLLKFMAALHPWGDDDPRTLGPGKAYAAIFPDTEPHAHLQYDGLNTAVQPLELKVLSPVSGEKVRVRTAPRKNASIVGLLPTGAIFVAFQYAHGDRFTDDGSDVWLGGHGGTHWVHSSGLVIPEGAV